jgi:hypothetical protein
LDGVLLGGVDVGCVNSRLGFIFFGLPFMALAWLAAWACSGGFVLVPLFAMKFLSFGPKNKNKMRVFFVFVFLFLCFSQ